MSLSGKVLYHVIYKPKSRFKEIFKTGLLESYQIYCGKKGMQRAALTLQEIYRNDIPETNVHFLTGKQHFYQTAFCLHSLQKHCPEIQVNAVFVDDGTMNDTLKKLVQKQFPHSLFIPKEETEYRLNNILPGNKYPALRQRRLIYPHLKKLTDIHTLPGTWKLVLDSDMLFLSRPDEVIKWLFEIQKPVVLEDTETAYGYDTGLMQLLTGDAIPDRINVGLLGMNSEAIDWDKLEFWLSSLQKKQGDHYYQEQALTAMLLSGMKPQILNKERYLVLPDKTECMNPTAVLHHYVARSKNDYYLKMWKKVL